MTQRQPGPYAGPPADTGADAGAEQDAPPPHRWRILAVTLLIAFMALLDVTVVNVAIPAIQSGLGAGPESVQWVVSGYALTFGLTLVAGGRLGDVHGRRLLLVIGLIGFVLASAAVGLAPNEGLVIAARLVQGAAAGLITPQNSGLIQQLFRGPERGVAYGYLGSTIGLASAAGPVVGGGIIAVFGPEHGWRYIFGINVPIGIVALILVWRWVPAKTRKPLSEAERHLDLMGSVLLGLAVLCLLLPTIDAQRGLGPLMLLLLGGPLFAVLFLRWEHRVARRGRAPLLDLDLLRRTPGYASGTVIGTVYFTGFTGIFLVLSIFLQEGGGWSALMTGLVLTPFALGAAVMSTVGGRLVSRIGRRITLIALAVMLSGLTLLILALPDSPAQLSWPWLVGPLLIAGLGAGAVVGPNQTLTLNDVPPAMGGAAGAAIQTGQRIGSALGAALVVTAYRIALDRTGNAAQAAEIAVGCSLVVLTAALAIAIRDERCAGRPDPGAPQARRPRR